MIIRLDTRVRLKKVQLLSHQHLIASKVEIYVGDTDEPPLKMSELEDPPKNHANPQRPRMVNEGDGETRPRTVNDEKPPLSLDLDEPVPVSNFVPDTVKFSILG